MRRQLYVHSMPERNVRPIVETLVGEPIGRKGISRAERFAVRARVVIAGLDPLASLARAKDARRKGNQMDFGKAIVALKAGERVAREGWNGKGMWLVLINPGNAMHTSSHGAFDMQPCIGMKTAQDCMQPGWLASQADMLAEDWCIL